MENLRVDDVPAKPPVWKPVELEWFIQKPASEPRGSGSAPELPKTSGPETPSPAPSATAQTPKPLDGNLLPPPLPIPRPMPVTPLPIAPTTRDRPSTHHLSALSC